MRMRRSLLLPACLWAVAAFAQAPPAAEPPGLRLLEAPPPDYPEAERAARHQGRVDLRLRLTRSGNVESAEVARSSGYPALDQAALEAARRWKFAPLGRAPLTVERPVQFSLGAPDGNASAAHAGALSRPALDALLRQPCSRVNDEAQKFRHAHPDGNLADMQTFRASAGMLFIDANAQPMDARLKLFGSLQQAWPMVLQRCAAEPAAVYGEVMKRALAQAQGGHP